MNGEVLEAAAGSAGPARPALLGIDRLERLALSQCERSAGLCGAPARVEKHEQRRLVVALVQGARSWHHQQDNAREEPPGADSGWPDRGHPQGWCDEGRPALTQPVPHHRSAGIRSGDKAHRGVESNERVEGDHDFGHGSTCHQASREARQGGSSENRNPGSKNDPYRVRKWTGQPLNRVRKWTMDRWTGSKIDPGEKCRIGRRASNGAGSSMKPNFPIQKSHGSKTGLLCIIAIPACNLLAVRTACPVLPTGGKPSAAPLLKNGVGHPEDVSRGGNPPKNDPKSPQKGEPIPATMGSFAIRLPSHPDSKCHARRRP
jgi:hypothetical protein